MNAPSREEIDAKLETIEARMDGRVASIDVKLDALSVQMNQRLSNVEEAIRGLKTTMIVTAIAVVLGIATLNATMLSNMVAAFESGKETAAAQAQVKQQLEATAALLSKLQARSDEPAQPRK